MTDATKATDSLVLIGYGDIARRVAERCPQWTIHALSRQQHNAPAGHRAGWVSHVVDLDTPAPVDLPGNAIWIYLAPPPRQGATDQRVADWLAHADARPAQVIYASTTSVYGDHQGGWVDEHTPPTPAHDRGRRRLDAEQRWARWCSAHCVPLTILRITGIYACDRLPLARIRAGEPVVCPDEAPWSNRIHADDLADLIVQLVDRTRDGQPVPGCFNVSDNHPRPMSELYARTADRFGLPRPPCRPLAEVLDTASSMAREFLSESKRIDASAIQHATGWRPRYPDLASALRACPDPAES